MKPALAIAFLLLAVAIALSVALVLIADDEADAESGRPEDQLSFLFVQHAESGTFERIGSVSSDTYILTLNNVSPRTIYYANRPERIAGVESSEAFAAGGIFDEDDPPNAAIVLTETENLLEDVLIVELTRPEYADGTLTYRAELLTETPPGLEGWSTAADESLPEAFSQVSVFIDSADNSTVIVTVTDSANEPIQGAHVALFGTSGTTPSYLMETDASGHAEFSNIYPGYALIQGFYRVVVTAAGYPVGDTIANAYPGDTEEVGVQLNQ